MDWIPVETRVPDDRREVLAWGTVHVLGMNHRPGFLGVAKFNMDKCGGRFSCEEYSGRWLEWTCRVSHWCEIQGPQDQRPPAPPPPPPLPNAISTNTP